METTFPPFAVTPAPVRQIEAVGGSVRVDVETGGCCGSTYVFQAEPADRSDHAFGRPGAVLAVSPLALPLLIGARLDYSGRVKPPRFRVTANPNTPERCPCNRSFGREWPGSRAGRGDAVGRARVMARAGRPAQGRRPAARNMRS
jgi:iron-sulfur cluster assembly accessory protein